MAEQTVADLRRLTRDLRPIYLEDGTGARAGNAGSRYRAKGAFLPITFETRGAGRRLPPNTELALYRIAGRYQQCGASCPGNAGCGEPDV